MATPPTTEPELVERARATTAVVRGAAPVAELPSFFDRAFTQLGATLAEQGITPTEPPFARYEGPPTDVVELEVGFVTDRPVTPSGEVVVGELPGGRVARLLHHGAYDDLAGSWERLGGWIAEQGLRPTGTFWEVYVTEPRPDMDPAELRTELHWLLAD